MPTGSGQAGSSVFTCPLPQASRNYAAQTCGYVYRLRGTCRTVAEAHAELYWHGSESLVSEAPRCIAARGEAKTNHSSRVQLTRYRGSRLPTPLPITMVALGTRGVGTAWPWTSDSGSGAARMPATCLIRLPTAQHCSHDVGRAAEGEPLSW